MRSIDNTRAGYNNNNKNNNYNTQGQDQSQNQNHDLIMKKKIKRR